MAKEASVLPFTRKKIFPEAESSVVTVVWIPSLKNKILVQQHYIPIYKFKVYSEDLNNYPGSENFFRIFNEIPTILMILIVLLAVMKPF